MTYKSLKWPLRQLTEILSHQLNFVMVLSYRKIVLSLGTDDIFFFEDAQKGVPNCPMTRFVPDLFDFSQFCTFNPLSYANSGAPKAISREIMEMKKLMGTTMPHELRWYVDLGSVTKML